MVSPGGKIFCLLKTQFLSIYSEKISDAFLPFSNYNNKLVWQMKGRLFSINMGFVKTFDGNSVFKRVKNLFIVPNLLTIFGL